jgi:ATP-dependent 26S proteasome regulatory subunit
LFFDELDTVGKKRDDQQELWELKRVVTVFLQNLDLMHVEWIIFWSTNHAELIDMALRRRFDVYINVNNPSKNEIENIFNLFLLPEISQEIRTSWINMKEFLPSLTWSYIKKISDHINRRCLIEESYDIELILSSLFEAIGIWGQWNSINKKIRKDLVLKLYNEEWWIKKISDITQIPYTTIRDWVLSLWNKKWLTI